MNAEMVLLINTDITVPLIQHVLTLRVDLPANVLMDTDLLIEVVSAHHVQVQLAIKTLSNLSFVIII